MLQEGDINITKDAMKPGSVVHACYPSTQEPTHSESPLKEQDKLRKTWSCRHSSQPQGKACTEQTDKEGQWRQARDLQVGLLV